MGAAGCVSLPFSHATCMFFHCIVCVCVCVCRCRSCHELGPGAHGG